MGLFLLIVGLALFIGGHLVASMRDRRASLIARVGDKAYLGVFSLVAAVGLVLVTVGFARYRVSGWIDVWYPPQAARQVAIWLTLPAMILFVAAYVRGRIHAALKHPMLIGTALWAFAHLLANGDFGSMLLFGSILAWALYDLSTFRTRTDKSGPPLPSGDRTNDLIAVVAGIVAFLALTLVFHPVVIGVPVFGG
jgi:uncharacterized membrane protein